VGNFEKKRQRATQYYQ